MSDENAMNQTANDCPDCGTELMADDDTDSTDVMFECTYCDGRFVGEYTDGAYIVTGHA